MARKRAKNTKSDFSGIAMTVVKSPRINFGYETLMLTIKDGVVVKEEVLTRGPDLPSIAVAKASRSLERIRDQVYDPVETDRR